jgi:hypothetical protein
LIEETHTREKLLGSLLLFTRTFFKLRTGREFIMPVPIGRENHCITISKELTKVIRGETTYLGIQVPPRYGKTELCIHFIAWALARYPDSNFIYVSYAHSLAAKQTSIIRNIITMPEYKELFDVEIKADSSAKDNFETTDGGSVYAAGSGGTIVGRGAGIQGIDRFGGCIVIDDIIKPDEAPSDKIRMGNNEWYLNTLSSRQNSPKTPILSIGQSTHEDDLAANLKQGFDGHKWSFLTLKALDDAGNALDPARHTVERLRTMETKMPYVFAAQYQQNPQPAGGGIFKPEWFVQLDEDPEMIATFVTADTAETDKSYNDATAFSFWGIYKIKEAGIETDMMGLHWIDCIEERVLPKDLEPLFMSFWRTCLLYREKPKLFGNEDKSTGVTLNSILSKLRGINILPIQRNKTSKWGKYTGKTGRFLACQPFVASGIVSLTRGKKHVDLVLNHMKKITANDSHLHDDICDTFADAVDLALIEKTIENYSVNKVDTDSVMSNLMAQMQELQSLERARYVG